jgi:hypothetical protein
MSDWTLGAVKARNMEIVALCEQESCRHMFVFNLDALIEGVGPDYRSRTCRRSIAPNAPAARSPFASPSPTRRRRWKLNDFAGSSSSSPGLTGQSSNPCGARSRRSVLLDARLRGHDKKLAGKTKASRRFVGARTRTRSP